MIYNGSNDFHKQINKGIEPLVANLPSTSMKSPIKDFESPDIFAVGGGKGGVGKTIVTLALGICLANLGKKTVLVDADFTGANLHTCLDIINPARTLKDFFERKYADINQIALDTSFKSLRLISGAPGVLGMANFMYWEKLKLMRHLRKLQADFVILDLGGGSAYNEIDLFLSADKSVLVSNGNGVALKETFNFIKIALFRKLQQTFRECPEVLQVFADYIGPSRAFKPMSIQQMLQDLHEKAEKWLPFIKKSIDDFRPNFVLNMMTENDDAEEVQALRNVTRELLGVYLNYWGGIHYDEQIRRAIRYVRPDLLLGADGQTFEDMMSIVGRNILAQDNLFALQVKRILSSRPLYYDDDVYKNARMCTYRCIAWNCCSARVGGLPCPVIGPAGNGTATRM